MSKQSTQLVLGAKFDFMNKNNLFDEGFLYFTKVRNITSPLYTTKCEKSD